MPRYIDADKLYSRVKTHTNPYGKPTLDYESGVKVLNMINREPTADVAPRIDVAREIFSEIYKIIEKYYADAQNNEEDEALEAATDYLSYVSCDLYELEKKYTGENEC